jgi:hypothetical protein
MQGSGCARQHLSAKGETVMTIPQAALVTTGEKAEAETGRAIQCKGCGEIGRAAWVRGAPFEPAPSVTRLSGNFYLHHGRIACGRCQQVYRID